MRKLQASRARQAASQSAVDEELHTPQEPRTSASRASQGRVVRGSYDNRQVATSPTVEERQEEKGGARNDRSILRQQDPRMDGRPDRHWRAGLGREGAQIGRP